MTRLAVPLFLFAVASLLAAEVRRPWTTSRVAGTPEPPKPFVAEQVPGRTFAEALDLATVPGTDRLLAVERRGKILSFPVQGEAGTMDLVLDLRARHPRLDHAFSVVLHPRFRENRELFVCYALPDGQRDGSRVSRFKLSSLAPLRADPDSEEIVITWLSGGHNGCSLQFGPDGCLYISTGDSGPAAPPDLHETGQDVRDLSSSIVRIDVDAREPGRAYRVPPDNPWVGREGVRPELWAYGLRNPWKISFDRATGNLWCGDIGWELWEMVHLIRRGANYGWSAYEASQPIKPQLLNRLAPVTPPIVAHPHSEAASITGGYVYHGKNYPELAGAYVYGDYATGKIWALWHDGQQIVRHEEIADTPHAIVGFGEDAAGELYYLHYGGAGTLHRLVRNPQTVASAGEFPRRLSATGLFADVARLEPAAGVYPFSIAMPMWQDGATATRWIGLRDASALETTVRGRRNRRTNETREFSTRWPKGAVLARTLKLGRLAPTDAEREKPVETQLLHYDGEAWQAYSYRWKEDGSDADLVPAEGAEVTLRVAADPHALGSRTRNYTWRFASRAECLRCHNTWHNGALAFTPLQLSRAEPAQVRRLVELGIVNEHFLAQTEELREERMEEGGAAARAVLHANCAACHTAHAGGSVSSFLNLELPVAKMNIVGVPPSQGGLGLEGAKIVDPGKPWNSVLALRMAKLGSGHMPLIGSREIDVEGLKAVEDWIASLPPEANSSRAVEPPTWDRETAARELTTVAGAMRVRRAIDDGRVAAEVREEACRLAWASSQPTVRDLFERFKPDELRERVLGANIDAAALLRRPGDATRGARLLAADGKLASCQACHFINGQGRHFGPELSRIGAQQTPAQLLESLLTPSRSVAPLFRTTVVKLRDGGSHVGFVRARGVNELVLTVASGQTVKVKHAEVASEESQLTSLMPEGLLQELTEQEAADLVAYLASLK